MDKLKYDKEQLVELILNQNMSYEDIGKMFNCTGNNIRKVAKRLGIILPQRRIINSRETFNKGCSEKKYCKKCGKDISHKFNNIFCDFICQSEFNLKEKYENFLTEPEELQRANYNPGKWIKPIILKEQGDRCAICGCSPEHNNKPLIFILDHIDGDASHNIRNNLRLVCPNCDTQLDTYKSKNKNGKRSYYRYKREE